jgi:uncharacterized protein YcbK (DUF882 family)
MTGPSKNLSWAELACKDGTPYPEQWRTTRARDLAAAFEAVRDAVGLPLVVLSGYRTSAHNRSIGGARASQHVEGRALDLLPPRGWTVTQLAAVVAGVPAVRGIGVYPTFVHLDVRPSERRAVWRGGRVDADVEALR